MLLLEGHVSTNNVGFSMSKGLVVENPSIFCICIRYADVLANLVEGGSFLVPPVWTTKGNPRFFFFLSWFVLVFVVLFGEGGVCSRKESVGAQETKRMKRDEKDELQC